MTSPPDPRALRELVREKELWLLVFLTAVFFHRPLFSQTFFFRDLHLFFFFQRQKVALALTAGRLPLWDSFLHGGQPLLADVNNTALYPTNALWLLLSPVAALNLELVLHFALCGAGAYLAARALSLSPAASLVSGLVFEFCGFTLSTANVANRLLATPWLALFLMFWSLFLASRRRRYFVGAVLAGVVQVLAGSPELVLLTFFLALLWALGVGEARGRACRDWAMATLFVVAVSAVQILPTAAMIGESSRAEGVGFVQATAWSVNPKRFPEFVLPGFLGPTDESRGDYWGSQLEDRGFPYILSLYVGFPALILATCSALARDRPGALSRAARRALVVAVAVAAAGSLGRFLPFAPTLWRLAPWLGVFRYPVKFLALATLPLALLAADGAGRLSVAGGGERGRKGAAVPWLLAALTVAAALAFWALRPFADSFQRFFFESAPSEACRNGVLGSFAHALVAAAGLALLLSPRPRAARWYGGALAALVACDLLIAGRNVNPYSARDFFREPELARVVRAEAGDAKLYRAPSSQLQLPAYADASWRGRFNLATLNAYTGSGFGIPVVFHDDYDGLEALYLRRMSDVVERLRSDRKLPFLSIAGVRAVLCTDPPPLSGLEPVIVAANASGRPLFLYRNPMALAEATFVSRWTFVPSFARVLSEVVRTEEPVSGRVVLEGEGAGSEAGCDGGSVTRLEALPSRSRWSVTAGCTGLLVFTTPFRAGWRAAVDGRPVPVVRANGAFQAVFVPAGRHEVSHDYRTPGLAAGAALSVVGLAGLLFVAARM